MHDNKTAGIVYSAFMAPCSHDNHRNVGMPALMPVRAAAAFYGCFLARLQADQRIGHLLSGNLAM